MHINILLRFFPKQTCSILLVSMLFVHCKKWVEVPPNTNNLEASLVFQAEATADAAIMGIYRTMKDQLFGSNTQVMYTGLAGDELYSYFPNPITDEYFNNSIQPSNPVLPWAGLYNIIFQCNSAIEQLAKSPTLSTTSRDKLTGEAKWLRGYAYWWLVNLFGDVPLVMNTDVATSSILSRSDKTQVTQQIIADLLAAQSLLQTISLNTNRTRVDKWTVSALLARVYLYEKEWTNAITEANLVIQSGKFALLHPVGKLFIENNSEAIFQVANATGERNGEPAVFIFTTSPTLLATTSLVNTFEPGDARKTNWLASKVFDGKILYYPNKFTTTDVSNELYTPFRLAELYLVRSEARAQQNDLTGARSDLDSIRLRAGLPSAVFNSQAEALVAIARERRVELFAESGHRWFELKRTASINAVMALQKPGQWKSTAAIYPLPLTDLQRNPQLTQNPGY